MNKEEAEKVAEFKIGWYNGTGTVYTKQFKGIFKGTMPFETAKDWAKHNLTYNEYQKIKDNL